MSETPPLPEGFSLEGEHPPLPEGFKLEGAPAGAAQEKKPMASAVEEARRAIAKADRDYIVPMIGLPADIVGWAFDVENMPGGSDWWKKQPGIGGVPDPETRAGKLGSEILGQGTTGIVQGGALGKGVAAGGKMLGAAGRAAASKIGGMLADPAANAASALGSAAVGQGLEALAPEGFEPLAHAVGSVLGGGLAGGVTAPPRTASAVDKAFEAYERLGLHPSASMVGVGGRTAQLLEGNTLPATIGGANMMDKFATQTMDKFQRVKDNIASQFGAPYSTNQKAGKDIQQVVEQGFFARKKEGKDILDAVAIAFGPNDRFTPRNLNKVLFNPVGAGDTEAVKEFAASDQVREVKALLDKTGGVLTYGDMLAVKTTLAEKMEMGHAINVNQKQVNDLVKAVDDDMGAAVKSIGNPDTVKDWEHGKAIYNNAFRDYEKAFKELLGKKDMPVNGEQVYSILMGSAGSKKAADIVSFDTVWRQLGKAKQGELAATVLTKMGNTDPAKAGSVEGFSLPTFLTNYKNLSPEAKQMLFRSTGNAKLEQALDDLMFAADKIGGWNKVATRSNSNISGTMMGQMGAAVGATTLAATGRWLEGLSLAAIDIAGPAAAAWALTNPKGIRAIANALNKANDAAIGAARGVMAINPPPNVAPGRNIPSGPPQQNPSSGNQIPKFAEGGVVTQPTVAMIGEAGPEAVVPLDDPAAAQQAADVAAARTRAPYARAQAHESGLPQMLDYYGNRLTSALGAPYDALHGAFPVTDAEGMPTLEAVRRAQGVAGMAMTGGMPFAQRGAAGMAGGKLAQPAEEQSISGVMAGVNYKVTPAQQEELLAARKAGAGKQEIQRLVDGFKSPSAASDQPLRDRIVAAYKRATGGALNQRVDLSAIRDALRDVPRQKLDAELTKMHLQEGMTLSGMNNPQELTPQMRSGALDFKGQPMYGLWISQD